MESLFSFPVGLFHPLQHAGLSRRSPDRRPTVQNRRVPESRNAKTLPSGDQFSHTELPPSVYGNVYNLCSVPPRAGITQIDNWRGFIEKRVNAICPPSGDHVGEESPALLVNWSDF